MTIQYNNMTSMYQNVIWQRNSDTVLDYTNLIMKKGLTVDEIANLRNVKVPEVNRVLNILKNKNPELYAQVEETLKINKKRGKG